MKSLLKTSRGQWIAVTAGVFLLCGGRLIYALGMDIHPDEAYYWAWSRMLDWSFNDQGPGIAFYIAGFTALFGHTVIALKLGATMAAAAAILFVYAAAREMRLGFPRALLVTVIMALLPGFFGGALLLLHDSALLLFWCAALYCTLRFMRRGEWPVFYAIFILLGLGVLTKYTMVFFALSLVIWFFVERSGRPLIVRGHFWLAALLGAVIALPLLIWNIQHDWEGISAILHLRSAGGANASQATTGLYIAGQLLAFSPFWLLLFGVLALALLRYRLAAAWHRLRGDGFRPAILARRLIDALRPAEFLRGSASEDPAAAEFIAIRAMVRFLFVQSVLILFYFLYMSLDKTVQPNWVFPAYPAMALIIGANRFRIPGIWKRRAFDALFAGGLIFALVFDYLILFSGPLAGVLSGKVESMVPSNRVRGFREAVAHVEAQREKIDPRALYAANRYQDASVAAWYLKDQPFVPSINILQKNQFSFWPGLQRGRDYVIFAIQENTCEKAALFWVPILDYMFESVEELPEEDIKVDGTVVKRVNVFYAKNFQNNWDRLLVEYLNERMIKDFMPNLKGKYVGLASKKGQKTISEGLSKMYLNRRGGTRAECEVF